MAAWRRRNSSRRLSCGLKSRPMLGVKITEASPPSADSVFLGLHPPNLFYRAGAASGRSPVGVVTNADPDLKLAFQGLPARNWIPTARSSAKRSQHFATVWRPGRPASVLPWVNWLFCANTKARNRWYPAKIPSGRTGGVPWSGLQSTWRPQSRRRLRWLRRSSITRILISRPLWSAPSMVLSLLGECLPFALPCDAGTKREKVASTSVVEQVVVA